MAKVIMQDGAEEVGIILTNHEYHCLMWFLNRTGAVREALAAHWETAPNVKKVLEIAGPVLSLTGQYIRQSAGDDYIDADNTKAILKHG